MIGEGAVIGEVFDQAILRIGLQDRRHPFINGIPVITFAILADIVFDTDSRDIEFRILPGSGGITEQGQGRGVLLRFISRQEETGMRRWDENRYRPSLGTEAHSPR